MPARRDDAAPAVRRAWRRRLRNPCQGLRRRPVPGDSAPARRSDQRAAAPARRVRRRV